MRTHLSLAALTLIGASTIVACGDDSGGSSTPTAGTGGKAGTAGTAGSSGAAAGGTAGKAGGAGTGGVAGTGGTGPTSIATCTGCLEFAVPVSGANDNGGTTNLNDVAIFQFSIPAPGVDFSNAVITFRVEALENNDNFFINTFAQDGAPNYYGVYPTYTVLSAANLPANTFKDIVLDLSAYAPVGGGADAGVVDSGAPDAGDAGTGGLIVPPVPFDKSAVQAFGIQLGTTAAYTGSGIVRVALDSVTVTGVAGQSHTFDTTAEGLAPNTYQLPAGTLAPVHH